MMGKGWYETEDGSLVHVNGRDSGFRFNYHGHIYAGKTALLITCWDTDGKNISKERWNLLKERPIWLKKDATGAMHREDQGL